MIRAWRLMRAGRLRDAGCRIGGRGNIIRTIAPILVQSAFLSKIIIFQLHHSIILYPVSCILHPASRILHPASRILHPASRILHPASCIPHPASCIQPLIPNHIHLYFKIIHVHRRTAGIPQKRDQVVIGIVHSRDYIIKFYSVPFPFRK